MFLGDHALRWTGDWTPLSHSFGADYVPVCNHVPQIISLDQLD
jgi:hypothetical protein